MSDARERLCEHDDEIMCADGFDEAIVGVAYMFGGNAVALYDRNKIIETLVDEGLTEEEAWEHYDFNIAGGYVGEKTPIFAEIF